MPKKKKRQGTKGDSGVINVPIKQVEGKSGGKDGMGNIPARYVNIPAALGIGFIVFLVFRECLDNQFTNWDDPGYVSTNPLIKSLSTTHIRDIFRTPLMGNYHPLTILSYAIDYHFGQLEPAAFHIDSLLLHVLVCILAYWFTSLLTKQPVAAIITTLLFALHPLHVESVAWVSDRKDLLLGVFYLLSCISYFYYVRAAGIKKPVMYCYAFLLFLFALLSKPVAVALPVTLILIDYFVVRPFTWKVWAEKIPFLALSVVFGLKSIQDQANTGAIKTANVIFSSLERIELGCFALCTYIWKSLVPLSVCSFYNYPVRVNGSLPAQYVLYPIFVLLLIFLLWRFGRQRRLIVFGVLFFVANIALLLQFVPVGDAIIADRYTYLPYFGLFLITGWLVGGYLQKHSNSQKSYAVLTVVAIYIGVLGYVSHERCKVWYNSLTLWLDVNEKQPGTPVALNSLGAFYFDKFNAANNDRDRLLYRDSAFQYLTEEMSVDSNYFNSNFILGMLYAYSNNIVGAKRHLYKVLSSRQTDNALFLQQTKSMAAQAYLFLGAIYATAQKYDSAAYCNKAAIGIDADLPGIHMQYGKYFSMTGKYDSAIAEYAIAIKQNPGYYEGYFWRGEAESRNNLEDVAIADFDKAISLNPKQGLGMVYYDLSISYYKKGDRKKALENVEKAQSAGFNQIDRNYYETLKK